MPCDNSGMEKHIACCSALQDGTGTRMVAHTHYLLHCVATNETVISAVSKGSKHHHEPDANQYVRSGSGLKQHARNTAVLLRDGVHSGGGGAVRTMWQ